MSNQLFAQPGNILPCFYLYITCLVFLWKWSHFLWVFRSWSFGWYHSTHQTKSHTFHIGCAVFFKALACTPLLHMCMPLYNPPPLQVTLSCCVRLNLCHMCCQWHPPLQPPPPAFHVSVWKGREAPEQSHATEYKWLQMEISVFGLKWSLLFVPCYWLDSCFKFLQR